MSTITEAWSLDAITSGGEHVAKLPLVPGTARRDWMDGRLNPLSITADVEHDGTDFAGLWLRLTRRINSGDPEVLATCVATDAPEDLDRGRHVGIEGVDPTYILSDLRALTYRLVCDAGTPVAETVRDLIGFHAPEIRAVIGDTDETLREQFAWDAGTPIITPINAMLTAAGYSPLGARPDGTLHSERWSPASERPVVATIGTSAGFEVPFIGRATVTRRLHRPNLSLFVTTGSQDAPSLVGRWPEYTPADAVTITTRGDATSQAVANQKAREEMEAEWAVGRATTISGPLDERIEPGTVVGWNWRRHGIEGSKWLVTGMDTSGGKGSRTNYRLQEVL